MSHLFYFNVKGRKHRGPRGSHSVLESLINALRNRELRRRSSRDQNSTCGQLRTHAIRPRTATMGRRMHSIVPPSRARINATRATG